MTFDDANAAGLEHKAPAESCTLRLGEGREFAEFEPSLWRLTVYHVLGVSRHVSLGYAEVYLLDYFAKHPGEMISRQDLLDHAWGGRVVSQGSLNQAISTLRALLGDDQKREIIITVPRRGYQLNAEALMDWQEWQERKRSLVSPAQAEPVAREPLIAPETAPAAAPVALPRKRSIPYFGAMATVLSSTLFGGIVAQSYYDLVPAFVSEEFFTLKSKITLIAADRLELDNTREAVQPMIKRLDSLGGGRFVMNQINNVLSFNCFRQDGALYTIMVESSHVQLMGDEYLQECLK